MKKKIIITLMGLLAVILVIMIWNERKQEKTREDALCIYQEKVTPLERERQNITQKMNEVERQFAEECSGNGTVSLIFTDLDAVVFDEIWPDVQAYSMAGVLMLSEMQLPGMSGNITMEQFIQIIKSGWEYCLEWSGEGDLGSWLSEMKALFEGNGLAFPETVYFQPGSHSEDQDEILKEYGITGVICHGEDNKSGASSEFEDSPVWHLRAYPFHVEGGRTYAENAVYSGGSIAFTIGNRTEVEMYGRESLTDMLEEFRGWRDDNGLLVMTARETRQYRYDLYEQGKSMDTELGVQLDELREQLEEVDEEMERVYEKYYPKVGD